MTWLLLLKSFWPAIVGVLGALAGVFFHQKAQTAKAEKATSDAKAGAMEAQASSARADAIAAKAALDRVQTATTERATVDSTVAALPPSAVDAELLKNGFGQ